MTELETAIHAIVLANRDDYMQMTVQLAEFFGNILDYKPSNEVEIDEEPNLDDYRQDDDFPHEYIKDLELYEQEKELEDGETNFEGR